MACAAVGAHAVLIDDFTTGVYTGQIQSGSLLDFQTGSMLGGDRFHRAEVQANPNNQTLSIRIGSGRYISSGGAGLDAMNMLGYGFRSDGAGGVLRDDLNANFTGGNDRIRINFLRNDLDMRLGILVESASGGQASSATKTILGSQFSAFGVDFFFSDFAGGASFADVDQLTFKFDPQASGDYVVQSIEVVPEPGTLAALGGALALLARRRRR